MIFFFKTISPPFNIYVCLDHLKSTGVIKNNKIIKQIKHVNNIFFLSFFLIKYKKEISATKPKKPPLEKVKNKVYNVGKIKIKYNYILIYSYDGRIKSEKEINSIQLFAKKNNLKIISAGLYQSWCDKNISASPFELLSYVRNAKYVVTDTFHGTVFSIKYNKQFATLIRGSNKQKLSDLLMRFGLESRKVLNVDFLSDILEQKIDYEPINNFIYKQNENSISYLNDNINNYNERI